ncbi:MAG: hypothetical protein ISS70_26245 [Phycisphaerae bacterium]|nr:hypothetical protein [Phycisphaerae bacterium]
MKNRSTSKLPVKLARGRERFDTWRSKQSKRTRLPESLWSAAVKLAREYGLNRTARVLRLDYSALKKRLESTVAADPSPTVTEPQFVPLLASELTAETE